MSYDLTEAVWSEARARKATALARSAEVTIGKDAWPMPRKGQRCRLVEGGTPAEFTVARKRTVADGKAWRVWLDPVLSP